MEYRPRPTLLVLGGVVDPNDEVLTTLIVSSRIRRLSHALLVRISTIIYASPCVPLLIFVGLTRAIIDGEDQEVILLVPCRVLVFEDYALRARSLYVIGRTINSTRPPITTTNLGSDVRAIALTQRNGLVRQDRTVMNVNEWAKGSIVNASPRVLPLVRVAKPCSVIKSNYLVTQIIGRVLRAIIRHRTMGTVVYASVRVTVLIFIRALRKISVRHHGLKRILRDLINTMRNSLNACPMAITLNVMDRNIRRQLYSKDRRGLTLIRARSNREARRGSLLYVRSDVRVITGNVFPTLRVRRSRLPCHLFPTLTSV